MGHAACQIEILADGTRVRCRVRAAAGCGNLQPRSNAAAGQRHEAQWRCFRRRQDNRMCKDWRGYSKPSTGDHSHGSTCRCFSSRNFRASTTVGKSGRRCQLPNVVVVEHSGVVINRTGDEVWPSSHRSRRRPLRHRDANYGAELTLAIKSHFSHAPFAAAFPCSAAAFTSSRRPFRTS